jgi:SAM-dependent methyltransferase
VSDDPVQRSITAFWSMVAPHYEAHQGNVPARDSSEHAAWIEAMRALLPPAPADILDVGTGTGFLALIAAGLGHRVTGVDLSEEMLAEARAGARSAGLDVRFEHRDAVAPAFAPSSFDCVACRHFLWTLREPESAFRNWRELVRPGGRLVAIDGHWFDVATPAPTEATAAELEPDEQAGFDSYYTRETRRVLPFMAATDTHPVVEIAERAGWRDVQVSFLDHVHALAEHPPSAKPWYVVIATR